MHRKKRRGKRIVAAVLSAIMIAGSITGNMPGDMVQASEIVTEQEKSISENVLPNEQITEGDEENWHVLGRPMTEEEIEEQLELIEYQRAFLGEIPQEERKESAPQESDPISSSYSMRSLRSAEQTAVELPKKYSSIEQGYTPAIRNQNPYGTCWAHASIALLEISMVKNKLASADSLSLSLPHAIYYYYRPVTDPLGGTADDYTTPNTSTVNTMYNAGGGSGFFAETTTAWMGPVLEKDFYNREYLVSYHNEYDSSSELNNVEKAYGNRAATVTEMVYVNVKDQEELKRAILEYGAVAIDYLSSSQYYNPTYAAQYCPYVMGDDHAVAVVGWNDYFPKENFSETPMKDGAWLVRNSWGTGHGDRGYFWLSYEDKSIWRVGRAYRVAEADKYDNNYQYDGVTGVFDTISCSADKNLETVNVFEIKKEKELLRAILFQTWEADYEYSIQIYKNPKNAADPASGEPLLETPLTGVKEMAGRYTMDLEQPIWLEQGDKIAVSVTYSSSDSSRSLIAELDRPGTGQTGHSFYRIGDEGWMECAAAGKSNFIIKAFTDNAEGTHTHQWSEEWSYDGDAHWHACTGAGACDANLSHEGRSYAEHYGGTASCNAKAVCEGCDQEYGHILADQHVGDEVCTVCGKSIPPEERKGVKNLDYEFTTINEEKISSAANGKPKLIIMFGAKCSISRSTMTDLISQRIPGVDICAVETNFYQKTDVEAFKESLGEGPGKDDIQFCYAPDDGMSIRLAYTKAYTELYPNTATSPLPIICYIDEDNSFKYMTAGQQDVEQIKKNLIAYCGYDVNNLNVANPSDATFTTLDDREVSAKAEGKPKVLVFFQAEGCTNSRETLINIAQNVPKGVDIYAIDMLGRDKETVANFKNTYTGTAEGIDYCYGHVQIEEVLRYMQAANLDTSQIETPVVCYIDADNQLQYVSTGLCINAELRRILSTCCNFEEEEDQDIVNDTIAPAAAYQIGTNGWKAFGNTSTFTVFDKGSKEIAISCTDADSGVESVEYYVSNEIMSIEDAQTRIDEQSWIAYGNTNISLEGANTYVIYVRVKDKVGNSAVLCSEGIVIYEDGLMKTDEITYTDKVNEERSAELALNGNTIKEIRDHSGNLVDAANYTVAMNEGSANITLKAAYLDTLDVGAYTYRVYLNPQGIENNSVELFCSFTITVNSAEPEKPVDPEKPVEPDKPTVPEDNEVIRIAGTTRYETGYKVADAYKAEIGVDKFDTVIVATGEEFADALSGSYLAAVKNAPILLTSGSKKNVAALHDYIRANVTKGGNVYILGGKDAVPETVEAIKNEGYIVKRLSGATRYDTNLKILEEAGITGTELIVATGKSFADSLSASALRKPILLVKPEGKLTEGQKAVAEKVNGGTIYIIGGTGAVSEAYEGEFAAYGEVERVSGNSRYDTSVEVARRFFGEKVEEIVVASGRETNFPDGLCGGPLAAAMNVPLILTADGRTDAAAAYVQTERIEKGIVLGGTGAIPDDSVKEVLGLDIEMIAK